MKKILFISFFFTSVCFGFSFSDLEVNRLIKWRTPHATVGVLVADAKSGKVLFKQNESHYFTPASALKLFTGAAALYGLGRDYRFDTNASVLTEQRDHHVLHGDLYLTFTGDPSLTTEDVESIFQQIKKQGIDQIDGDVVIDNTVFERPVYGLGWSLDDIDYSFAAPSEAVILDEDEIHVQIIGRSKKGRRPTIQQKKNHQFFSITNHLILVSREKAKPDCLAHVSVDQKNQIELYGCWQKNHVDELKLAIKNPVLYLSHIIKKQIPFTGKIVIGKKPMKTKMIAQHVSKPLNQLLVRMMEQSDNGYANSFIKALGQKYYHHGTFQLGIKAIKTILKKRTSINFDDIQIYDGAGLSRYALITPQQFYQLLFAINHDKTIQQDFTQALATSGIDGTLKGWKKPTSIIGRINAKTGTMSGISTLAGYVTTKKHQDLIFVIFINNIAKKVKRARLLQREMLKILAL